MLDILKRQLDAEVLEKNADANELLTVYLHTRNRQSSLMHTEYADNYCAVGAVMNTFEDFDTEFKSAHKTVLEVKRVLNRDKTSDDERSTSVVGIIDQTLEHHAAILLLLDSGMAGSAFALTRPVTEAVVRGVWLTACATDAEVMKFVNKDKIELTYGQMSEAIDATCGIEYFSAFKTQSWKTLNSYTHTGMLQIGRRFTGDKLQPSYSDKEKIEVLRVVTASILLLVRPFLARQGHLDSAKQIDKLMVRPRKGQ